MNYEYGIFYLYSIHNSNDNNKKRAPVKRLNLGICKTSKLKPTFFKRDNEKNDHVRVQYSCMVVFFMSLLFQMLFQRFYHQVADEAPA